ncbi:hypothetical protein HRbin22_00172 [Candidatus Thermoflexus japonica]|uniref:Putative restriction endonuclease domain-containing protein n=1 Tax=Candidatus Thermoflexus japonica TaxID=2035417 RepID=A0A2H5Y3D7_9CHLR|nr:hypothetical protein HRbin22_00172 [Candidatus Thermoflexus japonica]
MATVPETRVQVKVQPFHPYLLRLYGISEAEFDALGDEDLKAEYMDGVMIVHSPASVSHEWRVALLLTLLNLYVSEQGRGIVLGGNALFRVGPRRFAPDIMVVGDATRVTSKEIEGPPDLAIEVLSESTRDYDLGEKRGAYREAGVREIWWVDAEARVVMVERQREGYVPERIHEGWVVSEAVPGFRIRAEWLWQDPLPSVIRCWEAIHGV